MANGTKEDLNEEVLLDNIGKIAYSLDKTYLFSLQSDYDVVAFEADAGMSVDFEDNIRALKVTRWMYKKEEKPGECLKNVLSAFADGDHSLAMVVKRGPRGSEMYFAIQNKGDGRNEDSQKNLELLDSVIKGSFPGTQTELLAAGERTEEKFSFEDEITYAGARERLYSSVAVLTNTPSEFSEDYLSQGLEKLLDGVVPGKEKDSYAVVFLAESLSREQVREIVSGYEDLASAIAPFAQYQFQMGSSETKSNGETYSVTDTESISNSVFKTQSVNLGLSVGSNKSTNIGLAKFLRVLSISRSTGKSKGASAGYGYSWGKSKTISNGMSRTAGTSSSMSLGKSESTTYSYKSFMVSNLLERLEKTMKRLNEGGAVGLWKYSTYVFASESSVSVNVANFLRGLTQGKESYIEPAVIQEWTYSTGNGIQPFDEIRKYVSHFCHPVFVNEEMAVTATSYVATDKLSNVIVFPRRSIPGIPVLETVEFGREPHSLSTLKPDLRVGAGYAMRQTRPEQTVELSREELTKHTFITGSTGSGKSNTIYTILNRLTEGGKVHFLVIEPAKGEYRQVFGGRPGVKCYGTNPKIKGMELLRIDPFSFPPNIHVLEHMDRLVEIFNVCWPMYAAMPAILKDAIERAYTAAGWDLAASENKYGGDLFPTFRDVLEQIRIVLNSSDYSADNKGDYTGALVTRLKSLTNGINGQIFTPDGCSDTELFDKNTIVDLSRVGSSETKALIMGLLILKLQEHRMDSSKPNSKISHVTVLEEAHALLRRTSTEQSTEGANLLGKSVEMLSNAIAEMRTYGEGFIIADQSPGLLDMSVIRNTNTKIIMRLPDLADRELVGRAAGLNDDQIVELSRLERGVAAISQSDWLEPVLCMVDKFTPEEHTVSAVPPTAVPPSPDRMGNGSLSPADTEKYLLNHIMTKELYRKTDRLDTDTAALRSAVIKSHLRASVKRAFLDCISGNATDPIISLQKLVYDFFNASEAIDHSRESSTDCDEWVHSVVEKLDPPVMGYSSRQIDLLMALIIQEQVLRDKSYSNILKRYTGLYRAKGGVY